MCTAYIATLGLIYAGTTAAGGLTALALKMLRAKTGASVWIRQPRPRSSTSRKTEMPLENKHAVIPR